MNLYYFNTYIEIHKNHQSASGRVQTDLSFSDIQFLMNFLPFVIDIGFQDNSVDNLIQTAQSAALPKLGQLNLGY